MKFYKIKIDEDLRVSIVKHKDYIKRLDSNKEYPIEAWSDTIERFSIQIENQMSQSKNLMCNTIKEHKNHKVVMLTSTGKDSNVMEHIIDSINLDCIKLFHNTSLDCSDTYKRVKSQNYIIQNPERGFYPMVEEHGLPTRHHRWCCSIFKEGNDQKFFGTEDDYLFLFGIRNDESNKRQEYGDYRIDDRWVNKNWIGLLPIRKWSDFEIWLFTLKNNLWIHPKYKQGYARVGCHIACPFYTKSTWALDKYWYTKQYQKWHNILENQYNSRNLMCIFNCTLDEYKTCWNGGKYRKEPTEEIINSFTEYKGISRDLAEKYFNKLCFNCDKKITNHDVIAMNMKLLGRNIEKFMCKKCLMKYLGFSKENWNEKITDFKTQECKLF